MNKASRIFLGITAAIALIILGISLYAMRTLLHRADLMFDGRLQSEFAAEVRRELVEVRGGKPVTFTAKDGVTLRGIFIERPNAARNIVVSPGYRSVKEWTHTFIDLFPDANFLFFDMRAHGESGGELITFGCYESYDVIAAVHQMRELTRKKPLPLILVGISMGGAAALRAIYKRPNLCDALVLDSSYANGYEAVSHAFSLKSGLPHYPFFPIIMLLARLYAKCRLERVDLLNALAQVRVPLLLITSSDDLVVPPKNTFKMYEYALQHRQDVTLWVGPACRHPRLHLQYPEAYQAHLQEFFKKV